MIREVQGVGSIIVLILFLRQYSVQHISLKIMDGMDLFLQNMGRDLKRGVGEDEAGGKRNGDGDKDGVGNSDDVDDELYDIRWSREKKK